MNGGSIPSARDIAYDSGGFREQVYDVFLYADPQEMKKAIDDANFKRDDSVADTIRGYTAFKKLVPLEKQNETTVVCYSRMEKGKWCLLMCAKDFTWAYATHVNHGES